MISSQTSSSSTNPSASRPVEPVVIVGGGPTGLMLACELRLAGIGATVLERRPDKDLAGMRAGGLHMRTLEILDQRGVGDRFVDEGQTHRAAHFHGALLDVADTPTRRNYFLALAQSRVEAMLAEWAEFLGVVVHRGQDVVDVQQDADEVRTLLADGRILRSNWLVGCDGARSAVRKAAGIDFTGWQATKSWLIAEAKWREEPEWGIRNDPAGTYALGRMEEPDKVRIVLAERSLVEGSDPKIEDVRSLLRDVYGTDFGVHAPTWVSRFTDRCLKASDYMQGRVLLAGDAAHIHPPMGGQGLNLGLQDAVNLGWKLGQVVRGQSSASLLETYHAERGPVALRVLRNTMAEVALQRRDEQSKALAEIYSRLAAMDEPRRHLVAERAGLDIRLPTVTGHILAGLRMPDLDLLSGSEASHAYASLHQARPILFNFVDRDGLTSRLDDRIRRVVASAAPTWTIPILGGVEAPEAVLVRPDGYIAWAGAPEDPDLLDAARFWFGSGAEGKR